MLLSTCTCTTHVACSGVASKEMKTERVAETVVQYFQHATLHTADILTAVGLVSDVDKVLHCWSVHLLVLASNQHGCDPH